jgi:hypothetical protein
MDVQKNAITNAYAQVFAVREQLNAEGMSSKTAKPDCEA